MLTCEICGEEILLEEDMKTHLLLSHLENDLHCPLCTLSGVNYDELSFHITSAHPEEQQTTHYPGSSALSDRRGASESEGKGFQTYQSLTAGKDSDPAGVLTSRCVSALTKDSVSHNQNRSAEDQCSSPGEDAHCTAAFKTKAAEMSDRKNTNDIKEKLFSCPMCPMVCSCSFLLQEHVELHLLEQYPGSPSSDFNLSKELQHKQELERRQTEARIEREEFKKLQRQFGLDGRGGYRWQMERTMERAVASGRLTPAEFHLKKADIMETLASGVDDGSSRTQGIIGALEDYYQTESRDCAQVWLSADTDHYSSSEGDKGWGCGYRNFQMLLSSLLRIDAYSPVLQEKTIPCIPRVQRMIEEAWREGLDPQGASHFSHRLQRTQAWIGATEIYVLLTSLRISARTIDFHQPTGSKNTHPRLFEWVKQYFCQSSRNSRVSPRLILTCLPPLYLQHQGHSRTVVGLEQRKNGSLCLLLLDPGWSASDTRKLLSKETCCSAIQFVRKFPRNLKHKQYQLVAVQGVLSPEEKQMRISNSRTLCAERIP